jgi:hypothetical protein
VNMVMNFQVAQNVGRFLSSCTSDLSRRAQLHGVKQTSSNRESNGDLLTQLFQ